VTEQLKKVIDLSKEVQHETQVIHGQYDTNVHRHMGTLMRHDKTEREQFSALIEHKQSLQREIDWIREQKKIIDNFITKMAPTLDKCLCDGPQAHHSHMSLR
jgi:chaperonin cofactor prefoldin